MSKACCTAARAAAPIVTDRLDAGFTDPWGEMLRQHPNIQVDLLEFRGMLEWKAAALAARRATDADIQRIGEAYAGRGPVRRGPSAEVFEEQVRADLAFHQAIAEAAHNVMFGHLTASLFRVTHDHIDRNLRHLRRLEDDWQELRGQHAAIWDAVKRRQIWWPPVAAVRCHMTFVGESMLARAQHEERESRARVTRKLVGQGPERSTPGAGCGQLSSVWQPADPR